MADRLAAPGLKWWQRGIVYQIYPRSFQDSNGDGIGDLEGIRQRLPHVKWLGVDAIWISPFFPSPMADFGYDVSDYCGVDPIFGTLDDFDRLIAAAHAEGLKVILDFVPNHTSDQHAWFKESRASRESARRDWYIWRDPKPDGSPPNNWVSNFGGSGWEFDPATGQYYYHAFLKEQPDLNWRNPEVRAAMHDALRFWLDRGVDGFRVDVIWHLIKDGDLRDNPPNPSYTAGRPDIERFLQVYSADQDEVHDVIEELRAVLEEYDDRVLIGELYLPMERLMLYYGRDLRGAHLPFNFQLIDAAWHAPHLHRLIDEYERALPEGGWPNWVLGNHDKPRVASRIGGAQARVAAIMLLTLRGTPTLYYGDEIGMEQVAVAPEDVQDPWEKNEPGLGFNRDPARSPMQWDASPYAGFSATRPWLPLAPDFGERNVAALAEDPRSLLSLYRSLIALRTATEALTSGNYTELRAEGDVLVYDRTGSDGETIRIVLNLGHAWEEIDLGPVRGMILISASGTAVGEERTGRFHIGPAEGLVMRLAGDR